MTVVALAIAPMPAGARWAAHANSTNGTAEFSIAMPASRSHRTRVNCARTCQKNGIRTSAPRNNRTSTSAKEPKSCAETRWKRNDAPQIAPSNKSSIGVSQALAVEATVPADPGNRTVATRVVDMMKLICGSGAKPNCPCSPVPSKSILLHSATNLICAFMPSSSRYRSAVT
jgi:hypothetical protein